MYFLAKNPAGIKRVVFNFTTKIILSLSESDFLISGFHEIGHISAANPKKYLFLKSILHNIGVVEDWNVRVRTPKISCVVHFDTTGWYQIPISASRIW